MSDRLNIGESDSDEKVSIFGPKDKPILLSAKPLKLTPKKAEELAKLDAYARQRSKKPSLLKFLADKVQNGLWYGNRIAIAQLDFDYDVEGVKVRELLVNGGHTLRMHIDYDFTTENNQLLFFRCRNLNSLALLYNQFDRSESSRSTGDQCLAFLDSMSDPDNWTGQSLNKCSTAAAVVEHGLSYRSSTKSEDRVSIMKSQRYLPHATFLRDLIYHTEGGEKRNRFLAKSVAVMSQILLSHIVDGPSSEEFWNAVRTGVGLKPNSPQLALHNFLLKTSAGGGINSKTLYVIVCRCQQAWNAFRRNKPLAQFNGRIPPELPGMI